MLGQDWPDTPLTAALGPKDRKLLLHGLLRAKPSCTASRSPPAPRRTASWARSRALALSEQALALLRASGSRPGEALVLENLGLAEAAVPAGPKPPRRSCALRKRHDDGKPGADIVKA